MFVTVTVADEDDTGAAHEYDVPPVADKSDEPPETTVEGEADAAAEGKASIVNCNTLEYASTPALVAFRLTHVVCDITFEKV